MHEINTPATSNAHIRAKALIDRLGLRESYPFKSNFIETAMGAMHFIDEGQGNVILAIHGNPTWSYLYRDFIKDLSTTHRVVAPDHIGFGLSDKPSNEEDYTIERHIDNLEALVLALDLTNLTLIVQDWGGPIGLGMASRHPDRIKSLVLLNTFGFYPPMDTADPDNLKLPLPLRLMRTPGIGDFLVRRLGFFERKAMPMGVAGGAQFKKVAKAYTGVFDGTGDRAGVMAFPRLIPTTSQHPSAQILLNETTPFLTSFKGPTRIFWGMKDPFFPVEALHAWKKRLPAAKVTELPTAKHYIQEDAPEIIIPEIRSFLESKA